LIIVIVNILMRTFDLNLIPILLAIYEQGSVSAAAQQIGLGQSAVSAALAKLRQRYGDPLFLRRAGGMEPTARMRSLAGPLREALGTMNASFAVAPDFDPKTTERTFTFALSDLGEMVFMPKILQRIHQVAPHASLRSVSASPADIGRGLETGEIDLAVGYFPDLREKVFLEQHLFFHHFVCLLRANHPIRATALSMAQFLGLEHAVVYGSGRSYEIFERYLRSKKIQRRVVLETPHFMSIPSIISKSDLVVTVPHAVGAFVQAAHMNIRIVQPPMKTPKIDLKQHWHRNFQRDPKSRWLRGLVAGLFTDELDEWRAS
jgi:DNA-binding transcriptional LysR family regulator